MKRKTIFVILAAALAVSYVACDDVFEKDLSKKSVDVIAPADGVTAPAGVVTFLWRATEGADAYHVTVVSPSFGAVSRVAADTLMRNDSISVKLSLRLELDQGDYQWSIRALNGAYFTPEQFYSLFIALPPTVEPEP